MYLGLVKLLLRECGRSIAYDKSDIRLVTGEIAAEVDRLLVFIIYNTSILTALKIYALTVPQY